MYSVYILVTWFGCILAEGVVHGDNSILLCLAVLDQPHCRGGALGCSAGDCARVKSVVLRPM